MYSETFTENNSNIERSQPIMVELISQEEFDQMVQDNPDALNLDYDMDRAEARAQGIDVESGEGQVESFLISPIDSRPKYSEGHSVCISCTIRGTNRSTGEYVSCLIHTIPVIAELIEYSDPEALEFEKYLQQRLLYFRDDCTDVDAIAVGGESSYVPPVGDFIKMISYLTDQFNSYSIPLKQALDPKYEGNDDVFVPRDVRNIFLARTDSNTS